MTQRGHARSGGQVGCVLVLFGSLLQSDIAAAQMLRSGGGAGIARPSSPTIGPLPPLIHPDPPEPIAPIAPAVEVDSDSEAEEQAPGRAGAAAEVAATAPPPGLDQVARAAAQDTMDRIALASLRPPPLADDAGRERVARPVRGPRSRANARPLASGPEVLDPLPEGPPDRSAAPLAPGEPLVPVAVPVTLHRDARVAAMLVAMGATPDTVVQGMPPPAPDEHLLFLPDPQGPHRLGATRGRYVVGIALNAPASPLDRFLNAGRALLNAMHYERTPDGRFLVPRRRR